jgi:hypothetical protein
MHNEILAATGRPMKFFLFSDEISYFSVNY